MEQGIQIPAGTIVNGQPFEKYADLRTRIAELEEELKALKPEPSIPDWIAPGKWVEMGTYRALIKKIDGDIVQYTKTIWLNSAMSEGITYGGTDKLSDVILIAKHFTTPPCPELPYPFEWSS